MTNKAVKFHNALLGTMRRIISKRFLIIFLGGILGSQTLFSVSADPDSKKNIISEIEEGSNNNIIIEVDDNLLEKLFTPAEPTKKNTGNSGIKTGYNKSSGFRIQVFSDGRNQHTLEARAKARGNAILAKFPKDRGQIYSYSSSPNWYTRVGNFRTAAEANSALAELKRSFPQFASEMRVVKSKIVVLK